MSGRMAEGCCCRGCKAPRLISVSPENGGATSASPTVIFTFNEAIVLLSFDMVVGAEACSPDNDPTSNFSSSVSDDGKVVTLQKTSGVIDCGFVLATVVVRNACFKKRVERTCFTAGC